MRGEAAQGLGIRQYCRVLVSQYIALINPDQGIQHGGICKHILIPGKLILLCRPVQELCEYFRPECQGQYRAAHAGGGGKTAADIIIHKERRQIIIALCQGRSLAGDGNHMPGGIQPRILQRILYERLIGQCLQGSA